MAVERKYERDVDLLLAEEFQVNPLFAERFKALTCFQDRVALVEDIWVSKSTEHGESDLIVVYLCGNGDRFALLIEDKIDAPLQPDQAVRYHRRAEIDVADAVYNAFEVILCAPKAYLAGPVDLAGFDHLVSLEQTAEFIRTPGDLRSQYRAKFLETAAARRSSSTWIRTIDTVTDKVWEASYLIANREFPELELKPQIRTKGSTWVDIRPNDFPTSPKKICVTIKGEQGMVDLSFGKTSANLFRPSIEHLLERDMKIEQATGSAALRIEVASFKIDDGAELVISKMRLAFAAASRLVKLYRCYRVEFDAAAMAATLPRV